ncbi:unnamed protein product [Strongylus vulgaris]|uniref:Uncharacterized protein n=1 Tax=Strongylus vulgaris TaxID=40348 RepID=A0A3P7KP08_STRVU|nr:unnamed protein product [Strongylus vulgaris]
MKFRSGYYCGAHPWSRVESVTRPITSTNTRNAVPTDRAGG